MPAHGDTAKQTEATLLAIQRTLESLTGDVVKMTIFLVGDPGAGGRMDFDGFMRSYRKFYGTADVQLQRPGRPEEPVSGRGKGGQVGSWSAPIGIPSSALLCVRSMQWTQCQRGLSSALVHTPSREQRHAAAAAFCKTPADGLRGDTCGAAAGLEQRSD